MSIESVSAEVTIKDYGGDRLTVCTCGNNSWVNMSINGGTSVEVTEPGDAKAIMAIFRAVFPDCGEGSC